MGRQDFDDEVYMTRPYHALYMSDDGDDDDDLCVWKDGPPVLPCLYDSEDEPLAGHFRQVEPVPEVKDRGGSHKGKRKESVGGDRKPFTSQFREVGLVPESEPEVKESGDNRKKARESDGQHKKVKDTHRTERPEASPGRNEAKANRSMKTQRRVESQDVVANTTQRSIDPRPRKDSGKQKMTGETFPERETKRPETNWTKATKPAKLIREDASLGEVPSTTQQNMDRRPRKEWRISPSKPFREREMESQGEIARTAERFVNPRPRKEPKKLTKEAFGERETEVQAEVASTSQHNAHFDQWPRKADGNLTDEAFRERELQYALSTTRRNLTRISQFMLKLEARSGKVTKEGIRQTLDATVRDNNYDFSTPPDADHKSEIEEIKHLSEGLWHRIYLVDRHWRRLARESRTNNDEQTPAIKILSELDIKEWIKVEIRTNHLASEETCFYTAQDLASHRSFWDWAKYLDKFCGFGPHPSDQAKLVELAWRFLDRNLRGPRPVNPTPINQFVRELEERRRSGVWAEVLKHPKKQQEDDAEAWKALKRYWSSRTAP